MIKADYHVHSEYSSDSKAPMEKVIEKAIDLGFTRICFTDHMDYDFPIVNGMNFEFDPDSYFQKLSNLSEIYAGKIKILKGIELGLRPYLAPRYKRLMTKYDFDFAIGSSHLIGNKDPYRKEYWEGKTMEEGIHEYFQTIIDNVKSYDDFDVYGHLDYVIRYIPDKSYQYNYADFFDHFEEILKAIISSGKGIEVNTAGYKYGLGQPHPAPNIIKRYFELGGEILTIGSDGHCPEHIGYDFSITRELLLSLGVKYYTVFEKRKPIFEPL